MFKTFIILTIISLCCENISSVTSVSAEFFSTNATQRTTEKFDSDRDSSGAQNCLTLNVAYEHGQKIPRSDPCEVCLCIDGEIFCWWKQCAEKAIIRNEPKPKQILKNHLLKNKNNGNTNKNMPTNILQFPQSFILNHDKTRTKMTKDYLKEKNDFHYQHYKASFKHIEGSEMLASDENDNFKVSVNLNTSPSDYYPTVTTSETEQEPIKEPVEKYCIVMGKTYKIGAVLPQETGNCLQCICLAGKDNKESPLVTCSPHNCPPMVLSDLLDAGY